MKVLTGNFMSQVLLNQLPWSYVFCVVSVNSSSPVYMPEVMERCLIIPLYNTAHHSRFLNTKFQMHHIISSWKSHCINSMKHGLKSIVTTVLISYTLLKRSCGYWLFYFVFIILIFTFIVIISVVFDKTKTDYRYLSVRIDIRQQHHNWQFGRLWARGFIVLIEDTVMHSYIFIKL